MEKKTCFMIMPISTPNDRLHLYNNDKEHFIHVMECIFKPAIKKASFEPISPIAEGSQQIHAEIISKIETSDLVLCDMSILNPNVFFELGIRTALNKPVCLVKDNFTEEVPFDTNNINNHTYSADLSSWIVTKEIDNLAEHIKKSYDKNKNTNTLWRYFGLKNIAHPIEATGEADKFDYLNMQLEGARKQLDSIEELLLKRDTLEDIRRKRKWISEMESVLVGDIDHNKEKIERESLLHEFWKEQDRLNRKPIPDDIIEYVRIYASDCGTRALGANFTNKSYSINLEKPLGIEDMSKLKLTLKDQGYDLSFKNNVLTISKLYK